jgi:hypothetical protein
VRAKISQQVVEAAARLDTQMALEMKANANA